jgi:hypothetical protein
MEPVTVGGDAGNAVPAGVREEFEGKCGGRGCLGARGESGIPPDMIRGVNGNELASPGLSLGIRGKGDPRGRSIGLGLAGNPGLV